MIAILTYLCSAYHEQPCNANGRLALFDAEDVNDIMDSRTSVLGALQRSGLSGDEYALVGKQKYAEVMEKLRIPPDVAEELWRDFKVEELHHDVYGQPDFQDCCLSVGDLLLLLGVSDDVELLARHWCRLLPADKVGPL